MTKKFVIIAGIIALAAAAAAAVACFLLKKTDLVENGLDRLFCKSCGDEDDEI